MGGSVAITRNGRPVALLTRTDSPLLPISLDALRAVTAAMPEQGESAEFLTRTMQDEDRY